MLILPNKPLTLEQFRKIRVAQAYKEKKPLSKVSKEHELMMLASHNKRFNKKT